MNKQLKWGIILQYIQMFLNVFVQFIYTPIMIRVLGDNEYGIYSLIASIISYLGLISLGFSSGYIKFYSKYKAEQNEEKIRKLNGLYLIAFLSIGLISLVCGFVLSLNIGIFFNTTYSMSDVKLAKVLMIFLTFNLSISFPASLFVSYIAAHEKFIFKKIVNIIKTIIGPCLSITLLFLGYGSVGVVFITAIMSLIVDIMNIIYCVKKLNMKFSFWNFERGLFKEIFVFCLFIGINEVVNIINWQTDKIILGKMINSSAVAIYAVSAIINDTYILSSTTISSVFTPMVHRIENNIDEDKNKKLTDLFIKVGRIQFFVIMLIFTGFIFFGKFFISVWAGNNYNLSYYIALLLICPVTIPLLQNLGIEIQRAKNKHKFRSVVYFIMAIMNVGLSILFCHLWGIIGVAIGTTLSFIICNVIIMNIYYHKVIGLDIIKFWKNILKVLPMLILPCIFGILIVRFYKFKGFLDFFVFIFLYIIVYLISLYFIGFNREEKNKVKNLFKRRKVIKNESDMR